MNAVSYIGSVMNPKFESLLMDEAVYFTLEWLEKDDIHPQQDKKLRQSIIGDKVELGIILAEFHPETWGEYKLTHSSKKQLKLIELIEKSKKTYGSALIAEVSHI